MRKRIQFSKNFKDNINRYLDINLQDRLYCSIYDYSFLNKYSNLINNSNLQKFRLSEFRVIFTEKEDFYLFIDIMPRKKNYNNKELKKYEKILKVLE